MPATTPAILRARSPLLAIVLCLAILTGCGSSSSDGTETAPATTAPVTEATAPAATATALPAGTPAATLAAVPATPLAPVHGPTPLAPPASPSASPVPIVRADPIEDTPDTFEQAAASKLLAGEQGVYGYVVLEADGTVVASINGTTPFITASTYKLILMADILWRVEGGMYDLDDTIPLTEEAFGAWGDMYFTEDDVGTEFTIEEYLFATGAWSSNAAARTLLTLTTTEMLRMTAMVIGMDHTWLFVDPEAMPIWPPAPGPDATREDWDLAVKYIEASAAETGTVNISTPLDMARYQLAVVNDTLISPWVSQQVATILEQQALREGFPRFLDGEYATFSKPGSLPDAVNDVGAIFLPEGPRAVAMMSLEVPDVWRATLLQQRLAVIATGDQDVPPMPW
jgi:hypothetical protein